MEIPLTCCTAAELDAATHEHVVGLAARHRADEAAFALWASGYGVIDHDPLTQVRMHGMVTELVGTGALPDTATGIRPARTALAINIGSASLKVASYSLTQDTAAGSEPMETGRLSVEIQHGESATYEQDAQAMLSDVARHLPDLRDSPDLVVHRIVHGGDRSVPAQLTPATLAQLQGLSSLAPLHQPPALTLVKAAVERWPSALQMGVFDTSWHQSMPERYRVLPIPRSLHARGVKRYGFHGLAFQSAMRGLARIAPELSTARVVLAHLGGGSSLCAVLGGHCVNTTMEMTPLGGVPMATRSGSLDPGVLLYLQRDMGMAPDQIDELLWRESGLKGISMESGDMRALLTSGSDDARLAIDVYVGGVAQGIASMAACIGGVDAVVFSGGIGVHAPEIRAQVVAQLEWLGLQIDPTLNRDGAPDITLLSAPVKTFVLSVDEEMEMISNCVAAGF